MRDEFEGNTLAETTVLCWLVALELMPLLLAYEIWELGQQAAAAAPLWRA